MPDIAWSDVLAMAPQLSIVPTVARTMVLGYVNNDLDPNFFSGVDSFTFRLARVLMAAHLGEIQRRRGQLGIVTSERINAEGIDVNYMARLVLEPLQATPYGEQFAQLRDSSPERVGFVT